MPAWFGQSGLGDFALFLQLLCSKCLLLCSFCVLDMASHFVSWSVRVHNALGVWNISDGFALFGGWLTINRGACHAEPDNVGL